MKVSSLKSDFLTNNAINQLAKSQLFYIDVAVEFAKHLAHLVLI